MQIVPADSTPAQQMTISYGSDTLELTLTWNSIGSHWFMDIYDVQLDAYIAQYVPLVCGVPIGQRYGRAWVFYLADFSAQWLDPMSADDMGARCVLMIGTLDELQGAVDAAWAVVNAALTVVTAP
jgi:hypothetical protein